MGAGAAALGTSAFFEVSRRDREQRAREATTLRGRTEAYDEMIERQTTARVFAGLGGALLVTGVVLWVVGNDGSETNVALACPDVRHCGLSTWGKF